MTPAEIAQLKGLIVATAAYYGAKLADDVLRLHVEDLSDLPFPSVAQAYRDVRRDPKTRTMPLPATIRARVTPEANPEFEALEAANRIVQAISQFGPYRTSEARMFMGSLAWLVVEREGGWFGLCERVQSDELPTLKAQWRNLAVALHSRSSAGRTEAPELPGPDAAKVRAMIAFKPMPEEPA